MYLPREDSYMLAEQVQKFAKGRVLDMGTGSGIQANVAAEKLEVKSVLAVDVDKESIDYCKRNVSNPKITFEESGLFSKVIWEFDTIIFNPPYLPKDKGITDRALYGGKKGHEIIEKFFRQVSSHLAENGIILLLFSSFTNQAKVDEIIDKAGFTFKQIVTQHIFFEDLFVYLVERRK